MQLFPEVVLEIEGY